MAGNDPLIGQVFGGFRLEARLDDEVELVYAARNGTDLVEIVISARPETDATDLERCAKAAEAATRVTHPNVAAVLGSGYERGCLWLATESAGLSRLSQRVQSGKIAVDEAVPIIMQVVSALRAVHSADLLHGNLRAEHIGIDAEGLVKVTGMGRPSSASGPMLTRVDEIVGNAEHMAPEQILGGAIGPATDMYSVGLILYRMITGRVPFASTAPATLVYHQLNVSPEPPSLHDAAVPAALDRLIEQLLAKTPDQRVNSATEALAALEAISRRHQLHRVSHLQQTGSELSTRSAGRHQRFEPQFLGRDTEVARVQELARSIADGHGRAAFIAGEAGIGKTRLLTELSESLQTQGRYVVQGNCFFGAPLGPYVPIFDAISQLLSHDQGLIAADREAVAATFVETAPGLATLIRQHPSSLDLRSAVAELFGDDAGGSAEQTRFLDILFDILRAAATCRPLIVILEDLHWSDTGTQQFLRHLSHRLSEAPILLIATFRPEDRSSEGDAHMSGVLEAWRDSDGIRIDLPRLSEASTAHLTRSLFFDTEFRAGFDEYVYRQSQGNPFIAMEVLKLLRSRHLLLNRNGIWQAEPDYDRSEIPGRVEALVCERLDGLNSAERQLLQLAAVTGSRFSSVLLERASGLPRVELLGLLFQLEKVHRLVISVDGDYEFSHSMIREVLYGELPGELRREYHRLLAGLMTGDDDGVGEAHTDVGHHLFIAERFADALPHLVKAADEAAKLFSWDEAASISDDVFAAARAESDVESQITALLKAGRAYGHLAHYEAATERFQQCRQMAADHTQVLMEAQATYETGDLELQQGHLDSAAESFADVTVRLKSLDLQTSRALFAKALIAWGSVDFEAGRHEQAESRWLEAQAMLTGDGADPASADVVETSNVVNNLAVLATVRGQFDRAWALYQEALELDSRQDVSGQTVLTLYNMGMLRSDQERWDESLDLYDRALLLCRQTRLSLHEPAIYLNRAEALIGKGEMSEARQTLARALTGFRRQDDALGTADTLRLYGRQCRTLEQWSDGQQFLEQSIEINRRYGESISLGEALYELGELNRLSGSTEDAIGPLREAENIFARIDARPDLDRVRQSIQQLEAV